MAFDGVSGFLETFDSYHSMTHPCIDHVVEIFRNPVRWTKQHSRGMSRVQAFVLAGLSCLLCLLWTMTLWGRMDPSPPGIIAVVLLLLPYLYAGLLFLGAVFLFVICRRQNIFVVLFFTACCFSGAMIWKDGLFSLPATPPEYSDSLRVMTWNVQRIGRFFGDPKQADSRLDCITRCIASEKPDLLALLEVTHQDLQLLQRQLHIPVGNCQWVDYFGTGVKSRGGLAACVMGTKKQLSITRRKDLDLPPNWKYVFLEFVSTRNGQRQLFNFIAMHVAPPGVTAKVGDGLRSVFRLKPEGVSLLQSSLAGYQAQVKKQADQGVQALALISQFRDPTILAGDFNSTGDAYLHHRLRNTFIDTFAQAGSGFGATYFWEGWLPLRIDFIYVTNSFGVEYAGGIPVQCSDHRPVVSDVFPDEEHSR